MALTRRRRHHYRDVGMSTSLDASRRSSGSLPPGPNPPRAVQAMARVWRYASSATAATSATGTRSASASAASPSAVLTRDRDVIRRLYTGDPLGKRHGNDLLSKFLGDAVGADARATGAPDAAQDAAAAVPRRARPVLRAADAATGGGRARPPAPGEVVKVQPIAQALTLDVILQAVLGISDVGDAQALRGSSTR